MEDNISYFRVRASTERRMASEAIRANVAAIHLELAAQYQALVDNAELRDATEGIAPTLATRRV